jgi:hypothetical protein
MPPLFATPLPLLPLSHLSAPVPLEFQVIKEHNIHLGLSPAPPIIPNVITTLKDKFSLSILCHSHIVCNLASMLDDNPFEEQAASFYAASVVRETERKREKERKRERERERETCVCTCLIVNQHQY